ncbi:MAG: carboxypeptidase-like regulatory domain-containing protein, partial [Planctomycetota bacterium]
PEERPGTLLPEVFAPEENLEIVVDTGRNWKGRLLDGASGRPIEGARIAALNPVSYDKTVSAADGGFELSLGGDDADLHIQHPEYLPRKLRIVLHSQQGSTVHSIKLSGGVTLSGRLRLPSGEPVPGVPIGLLQSASLLEDLRESRTDSQGAFAIAPCAKKNTLLLARVPGWTLPLSNRRPPSEEPVSLTLEPTDVIAGRVVDDMDRPLAGAWVRISPRGKPLERRAVSWLRGSQEAWSDADGRFVIEDVIPTSNYLLEVSHSEKAGRRLILKRFPEEDLNLELRQGGTIEGRVETPEGEAPALGVIILTWEGGPRVTRRRLSGSLEGGQRHLTDESGEFLIEQVPAGRVTVHLQAPPYLEETTIVQVQSGMRSKLDIKLRDARNVIVLVTDEEGEPRPGVLLQLVPLKQLANAGAQGLVARTRSDGTHTFRSIHPGNYSISAVVASGTAVQPGAADQHITVPEDAREDIEVEFTLPRSG